VRVLHRLEQVGEILRAAFNVLATVTPEWPKELAPAGWFDRYGSRVENYALPKTEAAGRGIRRQSLHLLHLGVLHKPSYTDGRIQIQHQRLALR
jgi:hypothetical protein